MPPKSDTSSSSRRASSASPPYPSQPARRTSSKPKSARQQFSACGACRMRRVRCDLKDLQTTALEGQHVACSNCRERGLKCVDEFAQVKAVKLLRRGRRLQQVEAVYGKVQQSDSQAMNLLSGPSIAVSQTPLCYIPKLKPEFFSSPFFRAFSVQRPILDPSEFTSRYFEYTKGNPDALGAAGQIIAMVLVVWANSFGIDEAGNPVELEAPSLLSSVPGSTSNKASAAGYASDHSSASPGATSEPLYSPLNTDDSLSTRGTEQRYENIHRRKEKTNDMLREILRLIDVCGILRKPTWDGVRVLLLVLPLTIDVQPPMERLTMHESTLSQIYTLCSLSPTSSVHSGQGEYIDALVRARIFWYAYAHEGITTGLKGGRLYLSEDDLSAFQATLPPLPLPPHSPPHSPTIPSPPPLTRTSLTYHVHHTYGAIPLRVSSACRLVHTALTGPRARQQGEIDEAAVREAWDMLDTAWDDLDALRSPTTGAMGVMSSEEVHRFVFGWQILIFECHNVIREALKQRVVSLSSPSPVSTPGFPSSSSIQVDKAGRLHVLATSKCHTLVRSVVHIMRINLGKGFFEYDGGIARDGCFFAAFLMASEGVGSDEDVDICLRSLNEMKWAFCKSEEREQNIKLMWEGRHTRTGGLPPAHQLFDSSRGGFGSSPHSPFGSPPYTVYSSGMPAQLPGIQTVSSIPPSPSRFRQSSATSADSGWPIATSNRSDTSSPRPVSSHSSFLSSSSQALSGPSVSLQEGVSGMASMSIPRSTSYYSRSSDMGGGQGQHIYYASNDLNQYSYGASSSSSTLPSRSLTGHQASVLAAPAGSAGTSSSTGVYQQQQNRYFDPTAPSSVYSASGTNYPEGWQ